MRLRISLALVGLAAILVWGAFVSGGSDIADDGYSGLDLTDDAALADMPVCHDDAGRVTVSPWMLDERRRACVQAARDAARVIAEASAGPIGPAGLPHAPEATPDASGSEELY